MAFANIGEVDDSRRELWQASAERHGLPFTQFAGRLLDAASDPGATMLPVDLSKLTGAELAGLHDAVPERYQHRIYLAMRAKQQGAKEAKS